MSEQRENNPVIRYTLGQRFVAESTVVIAIVIWWLTSNSLPGGALPAPMDIARAMWRLFTDPTQLSHAGTTAMRVVSAVAIATLLGAALALLPRYVKWTSGIVNAVIKPVLGSFPSVGWAILGTIWFGISGLAVLWIQVLILIPFCLINVLEGTKEIDQEVEEMGTSFGRNRFRMFWRIELPMLVPYILSAARIAYGVGWKVSLVAELFGAKSGLGRLMLRAQEFGQADVVMAICFQIVILFFLGQILFDFIIRKVAGNTGVA